MHSVKLSELIIHMHHVINGGCILSLLEVEDHVTEGTQLETEDAQKIRRAKTNRTLLENRVEDQNICI